MQAVHGFYDNGVFELKQKPPVKKGKIIILFTEDEPPTLMSKEESLRILKKYSGSVKCDINIESERDEYLNEKYGSFD